MSFLESPVAEIQSAYAGRMASLYVQYVEMTDGLEPDEQDSATLLTVLLQSLLTNCGDLLGYITKYEKEPVLTACLDDLPEEWGVGSDIVAHDGFQHEDFTLKTCLGHLDVALSSPMDIDPENKMPATGFMPLYDEDGAVAGYSFVNSPLVRRGNLRYFRSYDAARRELQKMDASMRLSIEEVKKDRFAICRDKEAYVPYCRLDIPVDVLERLLLQLSSHLVCVKDLPLARPQRAAASQKGKVDG